MKLTKVFFGLLGAGVMLVISGDALSQEYSDKAEMQEIERAAREILQLKFDKIVKSGAEANMVGIRSESVLFSRRLDSRTYFVHDERYGWGKEARVFEGTDEELLRYCLDVLHRLNIPSTEIGKDTILREKTQVAQIDPKRRELRIGKEQVSKRFARISRQIEDLPVFSSHAIVGLTEDREIGFMELHWPEIPKPTITEAHRLAYKVKNGWLPPERKGATVESVEAGILHSPPLGFLMDIYPGIRVIYAPADKRIGRKLTLYFDRHGKAVPVPRQFALPREEPKEGRKPVAREANQED